MLRTLGPRLAILARAAAQPKMTIPLTHKRHINTSDIIAVASEVIPSTAMEGAVVVAASVMMGAVASVIKDKNQTGADQSVEWFAKNRMPKTGYLPILLNQYAQQDRDTILLLLASNKTDARDLRFSTLTDANVWLQKAVKDAADNAAKVAAQFVQQEKLEEPASPSVSFRR